VHTAGGLSEQQLTIFGRDQLFQLRSIEQNELAIVADSQNKAILVFTGVTIIFLPLSFFTSYYGMNLQGIVGTQKNEAFFWKVCGTVAFLVILFIVVYAFRNKLRGKLMSPMPHNRIV
jgi:Mg2+ and Co2+ transporter CorA